MIWVQGRLFPPTSLRISVLDRTFEHGLGLFETFRTWNGHPTLLRPAPRANPALGPRLGLPLDAGQLPDARAVADLIEANRLVAVRSGRPARLTLSGGVATTSPGRSSVVWMTAGPLPPPLRESGAVITQTIQVSEDDPLARHKTLNYWRKRIAQAQAVSSWIRRRACA